MQNKPSYSVEKLSGFILFVLSSISGFLFLQLKWPLRLIPLFAIALLFAYNAYRVNKEYKRIYEERLAELDALKKEAARIREEIEGKNLELAHFLSQKWFPIRGIGSDADGSIMLLVNLPKVGLKLFTGKQFVVLNNSKPDGGLPHLANFSDPVVSYEDYTLKVEWQGVIRITNQLTVV